MLAPTPCAAKVTTCLSLRGNSSRIRTCRLIGTVTALEQAPDHRPNRGTNPTIGAAMIASAKGRQSSCSWGYSNGGAADQGL